MGVATAVGPDGRLQLYVTNITDPSGLYGSNLGNTFMVNEQDSNGIRFRNVAAQYGILDTAWGWGTAFVDMNLDGAPDLYAVQGMRAFVGDDSEHLSNATSTLFLGDAAGGQFSVAKDTGCDVPGDQRALVVFDYDRDGSPDLLITQVAGPTVLLQNHTAGKHWLTVAPEGPGDAGIGARVTVTAGGRTTAQILLAGGSYLAGPPREAYFGLDAAPIADVVRIDWANGTTTELHDVEADQVLRVSPGGEGRGLHVGVATRVRATPYLRGTPTRTMEMLHMARDEERLTRSQEEPIVGGLPDVPGILTALRLTPELGIHLRGLADELLVNDFAGATIERAEREMLATAVSAANDCFYCMDSHGAFANALLERDGATDQAPLVDVDQARILGRLRRQDASVAPHRANRATRGRGT